jgi:hypothetical protein
LTEIGAGGIMSATFSSIRNVGCDKGDESDDGAGEPVGVKFAESTINMESDIGLKSQIAHHNRIRQ